MESLRIMPPVPLTARIAAKTGCVDGLIVPKGTLFYIPVRFILTGRLVVFTKMSKIRVVNTWKEIWGDDAEECVHVSLPDFGGVEAIMER